MFCQFFLNSQILQQIQHISKLMEVKKVFDVCPKQIHKKPERVKIKHKSFRQLLRLDRLQKIIVEQSDDEDDDFLQKLMKKQQKREIEEKKKIQEKKSASSKRSSILKIKTQASQKSSFPILSQQKKNSLISQNAKQSVGIISSKELQPQAKKKNEQNQLKIMHKQEQKQIQKQINQKSRASTEQVNNQIRNEEKKIKQVIVKKRKKTAELKLWQDLQLHSKRKYKDLIEEKPQKQNYTILKLSSNEPQSSINYNFSSLFAPKKSDALKQLQKNVHWAEHFRSDENFCQAQSIINPEKNSIQHLISNPKNQSFERKVQSERKTRLLSMSNNPTFLQNMLLRRSLDHISSQRKFKTHESLFRTSYQEQIFLKSLQKR